MQQKPRLDLALFLITITLVGIGVLMIYSSSAIFAQKYHTGDTYYYFKKQLLWIVLGMSGLFLAWKIEYRKWQRWNSGLILIGIFLLTLTLVPGVGYKVAGASRWVKIAGLSFQPAEFVRLALIIYLASFVANKGNELKDLHKGLFPSLFFLMLISVLLLLQPHLGMVFVMVTSAVTVLFAGGARIRHIACIGLSFIPAIIILICVAPYRLNRMMGFWKPWDDPEGRGYHIIQSLIALGSGGLIGVGLGEGKQKLFYLPESSTDFIFAIIGEEGGFLLATIVIALFVGFVYCGIRISFYANNNFGALLAFGITSLIAIQSLLNIGVVSGMLPTTGMPLPFISFGGSALLINMIGVGILLNIFKSSESKRPLGFR